MTSRNILVQPTTATFSAFHYRSASINPAESSAIGVDAALWAYNRKRHPYRSFLSIQVSAHLQRNRAQIPMHLVTLKTSVSAHLGRV